MTTPLLSYTTAELVAYREQIRRAAVRAQEYADRCARRARAELERMQVVDEELAARAGMSEQVAKALRREPAKGSPPSDALAPYLGQPGLSFEAYSEWLERVCTQPDD